MHREVLALVLELHNGGIILTYILLQRARVIVELFANGLFSRSRGGGGRGMNRRGSERAEFRVERCVTYYYRRVRLRFGPFFISLWRRYGAIFRAPVRRVRLVKRIKCNRTSEMKFKKNLSRFHQFVTHLREYV